PGRWADPYPSRRILLIALVLGLSASGSVVTSAQTDEGSKHYPGRYAVVCKPAPIVGCVGGADCGAARAGAGWLIERQTTERRQSAMQPKDKAPSHSSSMLDVLQALYD